MTLRNRHLVLAGVILTVLAVGAVAAVAAKPKDGKYVGEAGSGSTAEKITLNVDGNKITGKYCNRGMSGHINGSKFSVAYHGPGGVYLGVDGKFTSKTKAEGTVTTDYICSPSTKGVKFTANLKK